VVRYGGSLSGEHGDGQARAELLPKMFGPELVTAFEEFKAAWDPLNRMNPGKIVHPNGILDNLRHLDVSPAEAGVQSGYAKTHFHFPKQENSFIRAVLRCVGVGKCRNESGGIMCPSYRVTREEKHSTRGRAHLLFEMLQGEVITTGWKSEEVKEALDLCLSCKGCKNDCPTNVDMATYKAEFLSHYYEGRLRPRYAYAFGLIEHWAILGSKMAPLANFLTQTPGLSHFMKWLAGMSQERRIPPFATQTFQSWNRKRTSPLGPGPTLKRSDPLGQAPRSNVVMLWPDTYTNFFQPQIGQAAVEVLEHLGFKVIVPDSKICCGRPLYDFGFLDQAKCQLQNIMKLLEQPLGEGLPLIVLEPSCASVFRDELLNLFPEEPLAQKLSQQTFLFSEFLSKSSEWIPKVNGGVLTKVILQTHCHQKSVLTTSADKNLLEKMGYVVEEPESGCCGMAGAFGFESDHCDISKQIGEQALLPAIRHAPSDTVLVADGFSCREQISQSAGRKAFHLAEILHRTLL
jgi:Fe-S oxidoreductase